MRKRDYSKLPEADVVINYIKARKDRGFYSLIFASGLPGTGKSSTCLRLAELVSIKLTGENIITANSVFDDLVSLIKFIKKANPNKVEIGVIEEVSVLFPSRRAMAHDNVAIGKILDTARKKQVILFANAPLWPSIDSHLRALGNVYIETLRMNKEQGVVISKALRLQTNPGSGKTYFHRFTRRGREVHRIITKKPCQETWEKYEARKDEFMNKLYDELKFKALKKKEKLNKDMQKHGSKDIVKPLTPREMEIYELKYRQKLRNSHIATELGVTPGLITKYIKRIHEKLPIKHGNTPVLPQKDTQEAVK